MCIFKNIVDFFQGMTSEWHQFELDVEDDVRDEGIDAKYTETSNPYLPNTNLHRAWNEGAGRF